MDKARNKRISEDFNPKPQLIQLFQYTWRSEDYLRGGGGGGGRKDFRGISFRLSEEDSICMYFLAWTYSFVFS